MPKNCQGCMGNFENENLPRKLNCCKNIICTNCVKSIFDDSLGLGSNFFYCNCCFHQLKSSRKDVNEISKEIPIVEAVQADSGIVSILSLDEMAAKANFWYSNTVTFDISPELFFDKYMSTLEAWKSWMDIAYAQWIDGRKTDHGAEGAVLCKDVITGAVGNNRLSEKILVWKRPDSSKNTSGNIALSVICLHEPAIFHIAIMMLQCSCFFQKLLNCATEEFLIEPTEGGTKTVFTYKFVAQMACIYRFLPCCTYVDMAGLWGTWVKNLTDLINANKNTMSPMERAS